MCNNKKCPTILASLGDLDGGKDRETEKCLLQL